MDNLEKLRRLQNGGRMNIIELHRRIEETKTGAQHALNSTNNPVAGQVLTGRKEAPSGLNVAAVNGSGFGDKEKTIKLNFKYNPKKNSNPKNFIRGGKLKLIV